MALECCNKEQIILFVLVPIYSLVILFFWRWQVLRPFKLITVFLHELCHALATYLTCGKVESISVTGDEGGVTKTIGGVQWIILSAGYLGSSILGMIFVISSSNPIGAQVMAGFLGIALIVVGIAFAENWTLRGLCLLYICFLAAAWAVQVLTNFELLQFFILFTGVMNGLFAIYDIWDDVVTRSVHESDARKLAELTGTSDFCWGVIWLIISLILMAGGIWGSLKVAENQGGFL